MSASQEVSTMIVDPAEQLRSMTTAYEISQFTEAQRALNGNDYYKHLEDEAMSERDVSIPVEESFDTMLRLLASSLRDGAFDVAEQVYKFYMYVLTERQKYSSFEYHYPMQAVLACYDNEEKMRWIAERFPTRMSARFYGEVIFMLIRDQGVTSVEDYKSMSQVLDKVFIHADDPSQFAVAAFRMCLLQRLGGRREYVHVSTEILDYLLSKIPAEQWEDEVIDSEIYKHFTARCNRDRIPDYMRDWYTQLYHRRW